MTLATIKRALPYLAAIGAVIALAVGSYTHGVDVASARWQSRWNSRDAVDAMNRASAERKARETERLHQLAINEARDNARLQVDQAATDAAIAHAAADSLREHAARLATSAVSCSATAAAGGKAGRTPAVVLADVLARADARASQLAAHADRAAIAGRACEHAYDRVRGGR